MKTIRINETAYRALEAEAIKQDRSLAWLVSNMVLKSIKVNQGVSEDPQEQYKKNKPPTHPHFNECKNIFLEKWKERNTYDFKSWGPAHAIALNNIIKKIESMDDTNSTVNVFNIIMTNLPQFYHNKFLTAINKNYDTIIAEIKSTPTSLREYYGF